MSSKDLKRVMEREGMRVIDVASELRVSPNTVAKYLRGERINRAIQDSIVRYLSLKVSPTNKLAAS
jgi:predicted transcriptional regulator